MQPEEGVTDIVNVTANVSSRINLMRIVLISGIVFVHIPFDPHTSPFNGAYGVFDWLRVFLRDSLFRVGVPCLSVISGYLLFRNGAAPLSYTKTISRKTKTVVLPFMLWNGAFFLFVFLLQYYGIGDGYLPDLSKANPHTLSNLLLAINGEPINLPLYFLRDLFVCILLSPALAFLIRQAPLPTLVFLLLLAAWPVSIGIVLRNSILFSFSFGIYLSLYRIDVTIMDRYAALIAPAFVALAALLATAAYMTGPGLPLWLEVCRNLMVLVGIPGFWALSAIFIRSRIGQGLAGTGSLSFWIFCAHYPLLFCLWVLWNRGGSELYPIFYLLAAALALSLLPLTNGMARHALPSFYNLLTGSRARPQAASRAVQNRAAEDRQARSEQR
ncbi:MULTISPECIES: acyltransferase [unclassified Rhizobium]|jgi:peptidoglycan/LPS O-acetylase OafA/YrhL|uniref:acyltransferase family protein n=1 Tax=unclassified Rhizobium TaxID=2613769 RepID=UPI000B0341B5|nr:MULTISPECIES: acyltransferase [unclassified Rhizobium]RKD72556.1 succinoglycan biosynthesis protein ExoH [Rhizobium sp. WW_1]